MSPPERSAAVPGVLDPPPRLLLGPGPSNAHPRVLQALALGGVGHLDPYFLRVMDEVQEMLRGAWRTANELTLPVSGTGSAGMEAVVAGLVEPGDRVVVGCTGFFGERIAVMAERHGGEVERLNKPWGEVLTVDELGAALQRHRPGLLALVHAETSTGAGQPLDGVGELCREHGCLLLLDTVTSLGGLPLELDRAGADAAWAGTQKCLSCPPGLAPVTLGPRAVEKLRGRRSPVRSWYLDLSLLDRYWGEARSYHHTAPIQLVFALHEGLRLVHGEGLEARWARHRACAELLWQGLAELDLDCHVALEHRLATLTTVRVPEGADAAAVQRELLGDYNVEVGGGLGELAGRVWRIGLMGFNARRESVVTLLGALERVLRRQR